MNPPPIPRKFFTYFKIELQKAINILLISKQLTPPVAEAFNQKLGSSHTFSIKTGKRFVNI